MFWDQLIHTVYVNFMDYYTLACICVNLLVCEIDSLNACVFICVLAAVSEYASVRRAQKSPAMARNSQH